MQRKFGKLLKLKLKSIFFFLTPLGLVHRTFGLVLIGDPVVPKVHLCMLAVAPSPFVPQIMGIPVGKVHPIQSPIPSQSWVISCDYNQRNLHIYIFIFVKDHSELRLCKVFANALFEVRAKTQRCYTAALSEILRLWIGSCFTNVCTAQSMNLTL